MTTFFRSSFESRSGILPDRNSYMEMLIKCKYTHEPRAALDWFHEMLAAGIPPSDQTCGVLRDAVGEQAFQEYWRENAALVASAQEQENEGRRSEQRRDGERSLDSEESIVSNEERSGPVLGGRL